MGKQAKMHVARAKHTPLTMQSIEGRALQMRMKDPILFGAFQSLEKGEDAAGFLQLYHYAKEGKMKGYETFKEISDVLADRIRRHTSDNENLKYGVRYPANYLNFMTLLRSYGSNSARQYGILTSQMGGPSTRHLRFVQLLIVLTDHDFSLQLYRALVARSEDSLQQPHLVFENMARFKRLADHVQYTGPVSIGGDCTKVRQRLTYSNDFGSHVLGSVLPMDQCEVHEAEDIDTAIDRIKSQNAMATQVRAIMVKVNGNGTQSFFLFLLT